MSNLYEILAIQSIENNKMVNLNGTISIGFKVYFNEPFSLKKEGYNNYYNTLKNVIKLLPDNIVIQYLGFFDEEDYKSDFSKDSNFLHQANGIYYDKRAVPTQENYFIVSFKEDLIKDSFRESVLTNNKNLFTVPYKDINSKLIELEEIIKNTEASILGAFGEKIKRLDNIGLKTLLYKYFSLNYTSKEIKNFQLPTFDAKKKTIGTENIGIISLFQANISASFKKPTTINPEFINTKQQVEKDYGTIAQSMLFPLAVGLPFKHVLSVVIQKINKESVNFKFNTVTSGSLNFAANVGIPAAIRKKQHIENYKELINDGEFDPAIISMCLIIPEQEKEKLRIKLKSTEAVIKGIYDMVGNIEDTETMLQFIAHSPGNPDQNYKNELSTLSHAVNYIPIENYKLGDKIGFKYTDRFGKPFLLNIWNSPYITNKNGIVIGASGRGKSFLLNDYVENLLKNDTHIIIIDKGHSYRKLADVYKGTYFDSSVEENFRFNIFITTKDKNKNYVLDKIQLNFVSSVLLNIWKEGNEVQPTEKAILEEVIYNYYSFINKEREDPNMTHFYNYIKDNFNNFPQEQKDYFDFTSLLLMLKTYAIGNEKLLLNSTKNIDLTHIKFAVFEMKAIEKDVKKFNLLCLIITFLNIRKILKLPLSVSKSFIIDEALSFLKGDIGDFIGDMFATVRKENGQVLIVAQGIKFFLEASREVQEKIFANRDVIFMTNHQGYQNAFPKYKELLMFSEQDIELLENTKMHREIFLRLGDKPMILRLEKSPEEIAIYDTRPKVIKELNDLKQEHGSLEKAVKIHTNKLK